ncbi:hypothetical protein HPP92_012645 [Vanilla planifolia]|uniref:Pre-rRNA-processing protein RIX1 N-terminal domain-containing protein n=1 Tax=Vanilla planifolia TaxID=51239 RepID=A0A835UZV6_VANPL|nr:hypothetical protein HPP92_012645 [Vanilla planifolia]
MGSSSELFSGMNDYRLKSRILRSVVRDRLPDDKRTFPSSTELASVLSIVRKQGLLSELCLDNAESKLSETWAAAVDGWVDRVLSLASSSSPDKCWAGVCLLGVTCEECCADRFQSSYCLWFQKLQEIIQQTSSSHFVKVACCASLADLFTRLAGFSNLKKIGTSFAGKLIQPVIKLLNEDGGEAIWDGATNLLITLVSFFPSSIQRQYENVEAVLTSKIMAAECNLTTCKKLAYCLAMLPNAKGDEDSWFLIMQKLIIAINSILTDAFQGLEEEKKRVEILKMIVPAGKDPPLLGGQALLGDASELTTRRMRELLVPRVTALMHSCCIMLTNPYPLQVSIPVHSLMATVGRVLQMDGSLHGSSFPFTTSLHQELLCAELPDLHLESLNLLIALCKGLRSQLLPHGIYVARLLSEYFRQARLSALRIKVYDVVRMLLISMGVGMVPYMAQELLKNVFSDLADYTGNGTMFSTNHLVMVSCQTSQQNNPRKRKCAPVSDQGKPNGVDPSIKPLSYTTQSPLAVKIAALKALEALLTVGGSFRSENWRHDVDFLVFTVAKNACDAGWANEDKFPILSGESSHVNFQLTALEVLLSSLISPTLNRPPYLSQGLDLFRRGRQETGTKIAAFCSHALLVLEVLIHPRTLPMVDQSPSKSSSSDRIGQRFAETHFNDGLNQNLPSFSRSDRELLDGVDEEFRAILSKINEERVSSDCGNSSKMQKEATQKPNCPDFIADERLDANSEVIHDVLEREKASSHALDVEMAEHCDDDTVDRGEAGRFKLDDKMDSGQGTSAFSDKDTLPQNIQSPVGISATPSNHGGDAPDLSADRSKEDDASMRSNFISRKNAILSYDSDASSEDSLPDIVDGDPDTD